MKALILAALAVVLVGAQAVGAAGRFASGVVIAVDEDAGTLLVERVTHLQLVAVDPMAAIHDWKQREITFADIAAGDIVDYESHWLGGVEIAVDVRVMRMANVAAFSAYDP